MNMFVLSLLSKVTTTVDTAYTGETRLRLVCLNFLLISINLSAGEFLCGEHFSHSVFSHGCVVQNVGFDSFIDDLSSVDRSLV